MRYSQARNRRRLPSRSRTIPIKGHIDRGEGEDHGKYFKCWHCGFICDVDRDELGDEQTRSGDSALDYPVEVNTYDYLGRIAVLGGSINHHEIALLKDSTGEAVSVRHSFKSDVTGGCPFCGTKNWRGDY